jgi:disulfide bond formation protein DsbB
MLNANTVSPPGSPELSTIRAIWLILVIAVLTIGAAWYFELVLGYVPCELCLDQRIPYYVAIPLAAIVLICAARGMASTILHIALVLLALIFLVNAGLGIYHSGVEWHLWAGPTGCSGKMVSGPGNAADLMNAMNHTKVVSCEDAAWRLFGISMAGWNALISAGLAAIALKALRRDPDRRG